MSLSGWARSGAACLLMLALPAPATSLDYQIHGFAAQGFALSDGNNVIGESSSKTGNTQYFELGANGTVQLNREVRLAAQEVVRRSGSLYPGDLRLDYAFADYAPFSTSSFTAGIRAGRVKNPFGLYNDTRDVVFTRPGILLPSMYQETQGARSLLFSSDGGQLYGSWSHGDQYTSLAVTRAASFKASSNDKKIFFAGAPFPLSGDIKLSDFWVARAMNDWSGGAFRVALSYLATDLTYQPSPSDPPIPGLGSTSTFDLYVLSARYDAEYYSVTSEYLLLGSKSGGVSSKGDAAYVQADYRFVPHWSAMARFDANYANRNDRSGEQCNSGFGPAPRYACFTVGGGVGVQWQPDPHWGVWGEVYQFEGNSQVPTVENTGRTKDPRWNLLLLMAGYRF